MIMQSGRDTNEVSASLAAFWLKDPGLSSSVDCDPVGCLMGKSIMPGLPKLWHFSFCEKIKGAGVQWVSPSTRLKKSDYVIVVSPYRRPYAELWREELDRYLVLLLFHDDGAIVLIWSWYLCGECFAARLSELLKKEVVVAPDSIGPEVEKLISELPVTLLRLLH